MLESSDESSGLGSIAAGGRYDDLVGMFIDASSSKKKKNKDVETKTQVPCVGMSIGIERIYSLLNARKNNKPRSKSTKVFVASVGDGLLMERMKVVSMLWDNGIAAELAYKLKPKLQNQFSTCEKDCIPLLVIIGTDEWNLNSVKLKKMSNNQDELSENKEGVLVRLEQLVSEINNILN